MSLYRKYRPQAFSDVTGQDPVIQTLQNAATQDTLAHAYLFAGSRGTGKTSTARILAKTMLTRGMEEGSIKRQILEAVEDGSLVDLVEIDAASNRGIDDIRMLVEKIQFTPVVAAAKVYIVDEVHMLTTPAFNALLKTLEEPPTYAYFILATTELQKIPATIQSRCQRFVFRQIDEHAIVERLAYIAAQEHISIEPDALQSIARHAQGGMRDAISLLDQLQSTETVTAQDVRQRIGETGSEHTEAIFNAIVSGDHQSIVATVARMEQDGIPLDAFVRQLLTAVRVRLHADVQQGNDIAANAALLQALLGILRDLRIAPIPGLVLEAGLLQLCRSSSTPNPSSKGGGEPQISTQPQKSPPPPPTAEQKDMPALKKSTKPSLSSVPSVPSTPSVPSVPSTPSVPSAPPPPSPDPDPSPDPSPSPLTIESLRATWPDIVKAVTPAAVRMSLKNARVQELRGMIIVLSFPSAFHRDKVMQLDAARSIEETIENITSHKLRLEGVLDEERRTEPIAQEDMVNLAEAAADVF